MSPSRPNAVTTLLVFLLAGLCVPSGAQQCPPVIAQPAATLLYPYFEVDLEEPQGLTTLISVTNTSNEPVLAHVVLWSNISEPMLGFTLFLAGREVRSLNLRDVIELGKLPDTTPSEPIPFPSCSGDALAPTLSEDERATLEVRLAGEPDPTDGLCYAIVPPSEGRLATGYLTVDVLTDCSPTIRTPRDDGYFERDGTGLASSANVLTGELFFIDGAGHQARGLEAVAFVADASNTGRGIHLGSDRGLPGHRYRTRFMNGGAFDGGTELLVWTTDRMGSTSPRECPLLPSTVVNYFIIAEVRSESGSLVGAARPEFGRNALRLRVDGAEFPVEAQFGTLDLEFRWNCNVCSPPTGPNASWVFPVHSAEGRFSVALAANQVCE